ncbi:hypothetical protein [Haloparvum sp. AD34]
MRLVLRVPQFDDVLPARCPRGQFVALRLDAIWLLGGAVELLAAGDEDGVVDAARFLQVAGDGLRTGVAGDLGADGGLAAPKPEVKSNSSSPGVPVPTRRTTARKTP